MNEYAVRFFSLLSQSFMLDAVEKSEQLMITTAPHSTPESHRELGELYRELSTDYVVEYLLNDIEYSARGGVDKLKKLLNA